MALTKLGDVSTVAKTLVETLNDVLQNLDATGSVDNSVVYAGGAQTLAKFFYDRNDHGRGEVLSTLDIQLRLHDTLRKYARTLEIANKKVSEVVEFGGYIGVFRAVTHVTQGLDVGPKEETSLALLPTAGTEVTAVQPPAAPAWCARRTTKRV